jgi:hypothetical protein
MAQFEFFGNGLITRKIGRVEIIQEAATLADHHEKSPPRAVVFDVFLKVLRQMVNPIGQQSDLHVRRPGVALMQPKPVYHFAFFHILFLISFNDKNQA